MPSPKSVIQKKTGVREDLAASRASEKPIPSLSRRGFIGRVGGATAAAWTASAIGLSPLLGSKSVKAEAATVLGRQRAIEAYDLRKDAALAEYHLPIVVHPNNGDEDLYSNKIGNYSKGLLHNNVGEVDLTAYNSYGGNSQWSACGFREHHSRRQYQADRPAVWIGVCNGRYGFRELVRAALPGSRRPGASG